MENGDRQCGGALPGDFSSALFTSTHHEWFTGLAGNACQYQYHDAPDDMGGDAASHAIV